MSSAAGLSAAKRRRGAGSTMPPSNTQPSSKAKAKVSTTSNRSSVPGNMPPVPQVLFVHEERLRRIEKLIGGEEGDEVSVNNTGTEMLPKEEFIAVIQALNNELGSLKQQMSDMQSTVLSNASAIRTAKDDAVASVAEELENVTVTDSGDSGKKSKKKSTANDGD